MGNGERLPRISTPSCATGARAGPAWVSLFAHDRTPAPEDVNVLVKVEEARRGVSEFLCRVAPKSHSYLKSSAHLSEIPGWVGAPLAEPRSSMQACALAT